MVAHLPVKSLVSLQLHQVLHPVNNPKVLKAFQSNRPRSESVHWDTNKVFSMSAMVSLGDCTRTRSGTNGRKVLIHNKLKRKIKRLEEGTNKKVHSKSATYL